jgi:hypothetical protein
MTFVSSLRLYTHTEAGTSCGIRPRGWGIESNLPRIVCAASSFRLQITVTTTLLTLLRRPLHRWHSCRRRFHSNPFAECLHRLDFKTPFFFQ